MLNTIINDLVLRGGSVNTGASEASIIELSTKLGFIGGLPSGLKSLLSIIVGDEDFSEPLLGRYRYLLSCDEILEHYLDYKEAAVICDSLDIYTDDMRVDVGVKKHLWNTKWIPFLVEDDFQYIVDMSPDVGGQLGQIIMYDFEDGRIYKISESLDDFFASIKEALNMEEDWPHNPWKEESQ